MSKKVIRIDEDRCIGCNICVNTCQEAALGLVNGKAKLLHEDYCDGLGNCLPVCPTKAISFVDSEGNEFLQSENLPCGCLGSLSQQIQREPVYRDATNQNIPQKTYLNQWPVQIKLVPVNAPYFKDAHLLVAADCCAYAYGSFHNDYMKKRITIIGCPKLDEGDYSEKLTHILKTNEIKSVTIARMEVPCCSGLEKAVKNALQNCGKLIPWQIVTISTDGNVLDD